MNKTFLISICILISLICNAENKLDSLEYLKQEVLRTYGKDDLSSKPAFKGGYINFGYWKNIPLKDGVAITEAQRIQASLDLYKYVLDKLHINSKDKVLEVGCGLGRGCSYTSTNYNPGKLSCLDLTPDQIERAKKINADLIKSNKIEFIIASADDVKKQSNSYSKIYSVEAAQYFPSMVNFAHEAWRLLEKNGVLVVTSFFSTSENGYMEAKKLLPTVEQDVDRIIPIEQVRAAFKQAGFVEESFESIGEYVYKPLDMWIYQIEDKPWAHNFYESYKKGYIDYYVLVLKKNI